MNMMLLVVLYMILCAYTYTQRVTSPPTTLGDSGCILDSMEFS